MVSLPTNPGDVKPSVGLVPRYVFEDAESVGETVMDLAAIEMILTTLLAFAKVSFPACDAVIVQFSLPALVGVMVTEEVPVPEQPPLAVNVTTTVASVAVAVVVALAVKFVPKV